MKRYLKMTNKIIPCHSSNKTTNETEVPVVDCQAEYERTYKKAIEFGKIVDDRAVSRDDMACCQALPRSCSIDKLRMHAWDKPSCPCPICPR